MVLFTWASRAIFTAAWSNIGMASSLASQSTTVSRRLSTSKHDDVDEAIRREKRIKRWRRAWKLALIEQRNPQWRDLWLDLTT